MFDEYLPIVDNALELLPPQDLKRSNVYIDSRIYGAGAPVTVGRQTVTAPEESLLLFVDLVPSANWGHACKYLLVGTEDGSVQTYESQFPPPREGLRVVKRADDAAEWTLLTKASIDG